MVTLRSVFATLFAAITLLGLVTAPASAAVALATEPGVVVEDAPWVAFARGERPAYDDGDAFVGITWEDAGVPCPPSWYTSQAAQYFSEWAGEGTFDLRQPMTGVPEPGRYLLCAFEGDNQWDAEYTSELAFEVREPVNTLDLRRSSVRAGRAFAVSVRYQVEVRRNLYLTVKRAGRNRGCARSFDGDSGQTLASRSITGARRMVSDGTKIDEPGRYLLCGWIAESSNDDPELPEGRAVSLEFRVTRGR